MSIQQKNMPHYIQQWGRSAQRNREKCRLAWSRVAARSNKVIALHRRASEDQTLTADKRR